METKNCPDKCDERQQTCIPFFVAENQAMHADATNKRMLIALLSVCITFLLTIVIFVVGYTIREQNWLHTIANMNPAYVEVSDGLHEQPDS